MKSGGGCIHIFWLIESTCFGMGTVKIAGFGLVAWNSESDHTILDLRHFGHMKIHSAFQLMPVQKES